MIRRCSIGAKPGYQWAPAGGEPGECHTYEAEDAEGKSAALRAAARDGNAAVEGSLQRGIDQAAAGQVVDRGDFTQYADG